MEEMSRHDELLLHIFMNQAVKTVMAEIGEDKCFTILPTGEKQFTEEGQKLWEAEVDKLLNTWLSEKQLNWMKDYSYDEEH